MKAEERKPHTFCETPEEKCTMNYCDDNGCLNRKRELVDYDVSKDIDFEQPFKTKKVKQQINKH